MPLRKVSRSRKKKRFPQKDVKEKIYTYVCTYITVELKESKGSVSVLVTN